MCKFCIPLCLLSVIHSSPQALLIPPPMSEITLWTMVPPLSYLKVWCLILGSKFQVSIEAYLREGVREGLWWSLVVTEGICPISWGDLCLTNGMSVCEQRLFTHFTEVEIFVQMNYPEGTKQILLPAGLDIGPSCHSLLCLSHGKVLL